MITSIEISDYRGFSLFKAQGLGRVNLLVGKNNSGKTAFLEAVEFLMLDVDPGLRVCRSLERREESVWEEGGKGGYEVRHLFRGHELNEDCEFHVLGTSDQGNLAAYCRIFPVGPEERLAFSRSGVVEPSSEFVQGRLGIRIDPPVQGLPELVPLSPKGLLDSRVVRFLPSLYPSSFAPIEVTFITPASLAPEKIAEYWSEVALTSEETFVIDAMRIVEPEIEQLAYIGPPRAGSTGGRGGMAAKIRGLDQRVPLGSLGDGVWRLLALALALARSRDGYLLVDEIDTGLHHTAMTDMWKMILGGAERLNVQVFATTHSFDCVSSLAPLCDPERGNRISVQRIDPKKPVAVAYSEGEIKVVAERNIEVR